ncbi:MAG: hypothetical protein ACTSRP_03815 [Candidatus Helarchaeota archaeon]
MSGQINRKKKTISKWQVLRTFPGSLFMVDQSLKSTKIRGQQVELEPYLDLCGNIYNMILKGNQLIDEFNYQRYKLKNQELIEKEIKVDDIFDDIFLDENYNDIFSDDINELINDNVSQGHQESETGKIYGKINVENFYDFMIRINDTEIPKSDLQNFINLIKIQEDSKVEAIVFPKGYHCWKCGHYELLDSNYSGDLKCKCCQKGILEQETLIFICPICGDLYPIYPWWERDLDEIRNVEIKCPDNSCSGHIHLFLNVSDLMKSNWYCNVCKDDFINKNNLFGKYKERRLILYCNKCGVYTRNKETSFRVRMHLKPTTARLYEPLIYESITINNNQLNLNNLRKQNENMEREGNVLYWNLSDNTFLKKIITSKFNIRNIFLVDNIKIFYSVYGYKTAFSNNSQLNSLPRFFKNRNKYNVYFFEHIGNGMVFELDVGTIINNLTKNTRDYTNKTYDHNGFINQLINKLNKDRIQALLNDNINKELKYFKALHTFSHILLQNLFIKIGLESFGCKIILKDGVILLYEIDNISTGGLYQLTLKSEPIIEILEYLRECERNLRMCVHDCEDFCKQCSFIEDHYCKPFIHDEVRRWIPSNSLLSRKLAKELILK